MGFDLDIPESWTMIFFIIGTAVMLMGILGFFIIEENKPLHPVKISYIDTVINDLKGQKH